MILRNAGICLYLMFVCGLSQAYTAPKPGFATIIGSAVPGVTHADRGAPAPGQVTILWETTAPATTQTPVAFPGVVSAVLADCIYA